MKFAVKTATKLVGTSINWSPALTLQQSLLPRALRLLRMGQCFKPLSGTSPQTGSIIEESREISLSWKALESLPYGFLRRAKALVLRTMGMASMAYSTPELPNCRLVGFG